MDFDWQDIATLLAVLGAVGWLLRHGIRVLTAEPGCGCAVCEQCSPDPGQQPVQIDVPGFASVKCHEDTRRSSP